MPRRRRRAERCGINGCARNRGADAMRAMPFHGRGTSGGRGGCFPPQRKFAGRIGELFLAEYVWAMLGL
eukprot:3806086-Pyramimonas_sp.AAC.1